MGGAVLVQGLGKRFKLYNSQQPRTIMEAALSGWRYVGANEYFWALRDVSFRVSAGEMLGVIGTNGAGKSTLLRLVGGVGRADEGSIKVEGRVGALLDLGAGLHPDLTGRENLFVCGVVAGLTRREVRERFEIVVEFAELTSFIDKPVRTYSSGMRMRLAFSIAIHTDPEVLLVDEFLAVGDGAFQVKCLEKIAQAKAQGTAIMFVSHNHAQVQATCHRALWLHHGQIAADDEPGRVVEQYLTDSANIAVSAGR